MAVSDLVRNKIFWTGVTAGLLPVVALFILWQSKIPIDAQQIRQGGYTYINPLLECELGSELISREITPSREKVRDHVGQLIGEGKANFVSVYYRDLNNGPWFGINEREEFVPASLTKVPILISYLFEADHDPDILQKTLEFKGSINPSIPYFKPAKTLEAGQKYTVLELMERMIEHSDNDARDLLVMHGKHGQFEKTFKDLGVPLSDTDFDINVKSYAAFFRILFNASYLSQELSELGLAILAKSQFTQGIDAGVPDTVEVAHKFGEKWNVAEGSEKQLHDCGVVYFPGHPYLLCLMTRGSDFNALTGVLSDISRLVYAEVDKQF